jgi:hypothetical protein
MTKSEFQFIVDVINKEHDFYFECIMHKEDELRDDELVLRTFLLEARDKGFNVDNCLYKWDYKMEKLS